MRFTADSTVRPTILIGMINSLAGTRSGNRYRKANRRARTNRRPSTAPPLGILRIVEGVVQRPASFYDKEAPAPSPTSAVNIQ